MIILRAAVAIQEHSAAGVVAAKVADGMRSAACTAPTIEDASIINQSAGHRRISSMIQ